MFDLFLAMTGGSIGVINYYYTITTLTITPGKTSGKIFRWFVCFFFIYFRFLILSCCNILLSILSDIACQPMNVSSPA